MIWERNPGSCGVMLSDVDSLGDSGCSNPRDKLPLKYDHAFICDFVP